LVKFIKNNQICPLELSKLPEELRNFFYLIKKTDEIFDNIFNHAISILFRKERDQHKTEELAKQISEISSRFSDLLFSAIDAELPNMELYINAITQYFDSYEQQLSSKKTFIHHLKIGYTILQIFLEPDKIQQFIADFIHQQNPEKIEKTINSFAFWAIIKNLTDVMILLFRLNILSQEQIIKLIYFASLNNCSTEMISILINHILIEKEITKQVIYDGLLYNWISKDLNDIKLLFDKMELFQLNIKEIINCNKYSNSKTLLNKAIHNLKLETVEFLLSKGAQPCKKTLSFTLNKYHQLLLNEKFHQLTACIKILNTILQALLINKNEENIS